jgi:hypothetical protein
MKWPHYRPQLLHERNYNRRWTMRYWYTINNKDNSNIILNTAIWMVTRTIIIILIIIRLIHNIIITTMVNRIA